MGVKKNQWGSDLKIELLSFFGQRGESCFRLFPPVTLLAEITGDRREVFLQIRRILFALMPYREQTVGVVVESTYNWYWLVDALMEEGYRVYLAKPASMKQYSGFKLLDDQHDAFWPVRLLKLRILPEGTIYPRERSGIKPLKRTTGPLSAPTAVSGYLL